MNYRVDYSPNFYNDLKVIRDYIAEDDLIRADKFVLKLYNSASELSGFPQSNMPLQKKFKIQLSKPYKYLISNGYYIIYLIDVDIIKVYRAISCKQDIMQFIEFTI